MDPLNLLKSFIKLEQTPQPDPLQLRQGQIVNGKIMRFLPNEMAVIQIGSHRLIAKLDTSLLVNQPYWFKVQSAAGKVHLKLLKGEINSVSSTAPTGSTENLIAQHNGLDGAIEQICAQIPVQFGANTSELMVQWNGRRKEDGYIDPNNCRILFYLELPNIGEIFVDLQNQNRKLKIAIFNGTVELDVIARTLIPVLKENLKQLNYQLASLKIEPPPSETSLKSLIKKTVAKDRTAERYQGVDIRI